MSQPVKVWVEPVTIPTYPVGDEDTNPLFLEKRVYQGSSGKVYPYGVIDKLSNEAVEQTYQAIYLENDFLKIMLLPELGGRVQRAYDKVKQRDFIYHNEVIKPALVGLLGPWISGGIEFNWPQHHRPTTFMPIDYTIDDQNEDSMTVWMGEIEPMYGLQVMTGFRLYKDKALLEITGKIYNGNDTPRPFLWWANPAVKGGSAHQSIFPPDVTAVYDHGKRDVSDFPIATGTYYKVNYAPGTDISRYQNLPVPTSYMADHSDYDFVGAYCHDEQGGLLHIADHHISPGKKQWTWGNCEFGQAWDRNLTDHNGPYIELMTGVYTDNQPDFTWLESHETKQFVQNFLPYSELGRVHNANTDAAVKLERQREQLTWGIYAISPLARHQVTITQGDTLLLQQPITLTPGLAATGQLSIPSGTEPLLLRVTTAKGEIVISYQEHQPEEVAKPDPAKAPPLPADVKYVEELYYIGQHLEQYHHASRDPESYYKEGVRRDPHHYLCNLALAQLAYNRAEFGQAVTYADSALARAYLLNKNPACGKACYIRACAKEQLGELNEAYDDYFKSTWSGNCRDIGFYGVARLDTQRCHYSEALVHIEQVLEANASHLQAIALKAYLLNKLNENQAAQEYCLQQLRRFPLNTLLLFELWRATPNAASLQTFRQVTHQHLSDALFLTNFYLSLNDNDSARELLSRIDAGEGGTLPFYRDYLGIQPLPQNIYQSLELFQKHVLFPNTLTEIVLLNRYPQNAFANYLLGCFSYAKNATEAAARFWQKALDLAPEFAPISRCLAIYEYNTNHAIEPALKYMRKARQQAPNDARICYEWDYLRKLNQISPKRRLADLQQASHLVRQRDDLTCELLNLYNILGFQDNAESILLSRQFHPWEGGEGNVTGQYLLLCLHRAFNHIDEQNYATAIIWLRRALEYPENLGEGRLVGQTDNDIHFWLAYCYQQEENTSLFNQELALAASGQLDIEQGRYYNDQPADYLFYQAAALQLSGQTTSAAQIFNEMIRWAEAHINAPVESDFFAVSLPDLNVFNKDLTQDHQLHCLWIKAMGQLGLVWLGKLEHHLFATTLKELLTRAPDHGKAYLLKEIETLLTQSNYEMTR